MKTVSVIIPTHNAENSIGKVIIALEKQDYPNFDVVVVDDNSKDKTVDIVNKFIDLQIEKLLYLHLKLMQNETNLGLAKSMNKGIRASSGEVIITLHDDCVPLSDTWISEMVATLDLDPEIGIVSSKFLIDFKNLSIADKCFSFAYFLGDNKDLTKDVETWMEDIPTISDKCDAYLRTVLNEVGLFDESFRIGGEDMDLSMRVKQAGFRIVRNNDCKVLHMFNQSHREDNLLNHFKKAFKSTEDAVYVLLRYGMWYKFDSFLAVILPLFGWLSGQFYPALLTSLLYLLGKNFAKALRYFRRYNKLDLVIPIWIFCFIWDILAGLGWIRGIAKSLLKDMAREVME